MREKFRNAAVVVTVMLTAIVGLAGGASAQDPTPDPATVTAVNGGFTQLKTLVTGTLAPALFGLVVISIGIYMAVRWLRKGSSTA